VTIAHFARRSYFHHHGAASRVAMDFADESRTYPRQLSFINKNRQFASEKSSTPNSMNVLCAIGSSEMSF
jgi:hypothetical protein